jgi:hypothetical protein
MLESSAQRVPRAGAMEDGMGDEPIYTAKDVEKYMEKREAEKARKDSEQRLKYGQDYIRAIKDFRISNPDIYNPDLHMEIEKELTDMAQENWRSYKTHSNFADATKDAAINYAKAEANIVKRNVGVPNVRGGVTGATGLTTATRETASSVPKVELDEYSKKFLNAVEANEDTDWVKESLGRNDSVPSKGLIR